MEQFEREQKEAIGHVLQKGMRVPRSANRRAGTSGEDRFDGIWNVSDILAAARSKPIVTER